jgi:hypothetical protein
MIHRLRQEAVIERHALLIERASAHALVFLGAVATRFDRSDLPGGRAARVSVCLGSWRATPREMVALRSTDQPDVSCYVGARPAGVHLEVLQLVAIEPSWLKRTLASIRTGGAWWAWSLPRGLSSDEELRTFLTIAHAAVDTAARALATRLAGRVSPLDDESRSALDEWPQ